jgi:hypothetical protein
LDSDYFDAGEAARKLFDAWYALAVQFAQGVLQGGSATLFASTARFLQRLLFREGASEVCFATENRGDFVLQRIGDEARQVFEIFSSKPKFSVLFRSSDPECLRFLDVRFSFFFLEDTLSSFCSNLQLYPFADYRSHSGSGKFSCHR